MNEFCSFQGTGHQGFIYTVLTLENKLDNNFGVTNEENSLNHLKGKIASAEYPLLLVSNPNQARKHGNSLTCGHGY